MDVARNVFTGGAHADHDLRLAKALQLLVYTLAVCKVPPVKTLRETPT